MIGLVERRYSDFHYQGKLDRQHFSFVRTATVDPYHIYHHLLFCYNRTGRKLQVRAGVSLLLGWQLKRNPGQISFLSKMVACDLSGHRKFVASRDDFERKSIELTSSHFQEFTGVLAADKTLQEALLAIHRGQALSSETYSSKLISDLRLVSKQHEHLDLVTTDSGGRGRLGKEVREEIHSFLQDLIPESSVVSEGAFSLNVDHARQKLQSFQLTSPQNFVAHLVGGAVAGGASFVDIIIDSDDIVVDFDGQGFKLHELEDLIDSLLIPESSERSREFAVALNAALGLKPKSLYLETFSDTKGYRLHLHRDGQIDQLETSPFPEDSRLVTRVSFKDHASLRTVTRFFRSLQRGFPEADVLRERCRRAPIPVRVHQQDIRHFPLEEAFLALRFEHPDHRLVKLDGPHLKQVTRKSPDDFALILLAGPAPMTSITVHGVDYECPETITVKAAWALVVDDRGQRDLSYTGIQGEPRLKAIANSLARAEDELFGLVTERYLSASVEEKTGLARFLRAYLVKSQAITSDLPIFPRVGGGFDNAETLKLGTPILFTQRAWQHPLRSGQAVSILEPDVLWYLIQSLALQADDFVLADEDLQESQFYFERKIKWERQPQVSSLSTRLGNTKFTKLRNLDGVIGYSKNFSPAEIHTYRTMRPLAVVSKWTLPKGLRISVNRNDLEMDMAWNTLLNDKASRRLFAELESEIDDYYKNLLHSDEIHAKALLHYLLYRKRMNKAWKTMLTKVKFRMWDRRVITGEDLLAESGFEAWSSRWLRAAHLSPSERSLLNQLIQ